MMVATKGGLCMARSVMRIPIGNRWSRDNLKWIECAQWHHYKGAEDADGDIPEGVTEEERRRGEDEKYDIRGDASEEKETIYVDVYFIRGC